MKPMKNLLLMGLLSALAAGGAGRRAPRTLRTLSLATAPPCDGRRQGVSFRRDPRAGATPALKTTPAAPAGQTRAAGGNTLNGQRPRSSKTGSRRWCKPGRKPKRVYVLSVQQEFDKACGRETHILAPETADGMPRLNEKAMRVYDNMIAEADKQGLRLILPFIDHWWWWGRREQLAAFYHGKSGRLFIGPIARPSKPIWM